MWVAKGEQRIPSATWVDPGVAKIFHMPRLWVWPPDDRRASFADATNMSDFDADDGSSLTTVRGQSIDVLALQAELTRLRGENAHLRAALAGTRDGATVATLSDGGQTPQEPSEQSALSPRERVELFRRLFRGRTDTFPIRWHSATSGKSGYAPACSNEWVPGVCEKPRVKCAECENRKFIAPSDQVIYEHLTGKLTAGVYPLLHDDTCYFVVADFDDAEWREDAQAFVAAAADVGVAAALEISRSGQCFKSHSRDVLE